MPSQTSQSRPPISLQELRVIVETSRIPHLSLRALGDDTAQEPLTINLTTPPRETLAQLQNQGYSNATILQLLVRRMETSESAEEVLYVARVIRDNKSFFGLTDDERVQAISDPDEVIRIGARQKDTGRLPKEKLQISLSYDHPKLLLTIGDLCTASSCQSYRTGSHIESLLGYAIDPNVKGVASFNLSSSDFEAEEDFAVAQSSVRSGDPSSIAFEAATKSFRFVGPRGVVTSKPLRYAASRQILKLGKVKRTGSAGLFVERAYRSEKDSHHDNEFAQPYS